MSHLLSLTVTYSTAVAHHDARKALHDPTPLPRPFAPRLPPVRINVDRMAARAATALSRYPGDRSMLERVYVDRLLDYLEERHERARGGRRSGRTVRGGVARAVWLMCSPAPVKLTMCLEETRYAS